MPGNALTKSYLNDSCPIYTNLKGSNKSRMIENGFYNYKGCYAKKVN